MSPRDYQSRWTYIADRYGIPVAFLVALCYAIWCVTAWVAPRADQMVNAHVAFTEKVMKTTEEQSEAVNAIKRVLTEMQADRETRNVMLREMHQKIVNDSKLAK